MFFAASSGTKALIVYTTNSQLGVSVSDRSIDVDEDFKCELANTSDNVQGLYWEDQENVSVRLMQKEIDWDHGSLRIRSDVAMDDNFSISTRCGNSRLQQIGCKIGAFVLVEIPTIAISTMTGNPKTWSKAEDELGSDYAADRLAHLNFPTGP
jgi:hypothetical protein